MEQLTVKKLRELCDYEISKGNANKKIVISDDDEGNGFHGLFFSFTEVGDFKETLELSGFDDTKDLIILG